MRIQSKIFSNMSFKFRFLNLFMVNKRYLHYSDKPYKEITFRVPWGNISGKWWGPTSKKPILCLHGYQDNCGSFDRLIPVLRKDNDISFLAIDLPGHGYSSPFPRGMLYSLMSYILIIERIYAQFKWSTLPLMGHSLGAIIVFCYTILYPEKVHYTICIDALQPLLSRISADTIKKNINRYMLYDRETLDEPSSYTWEEIMQKVSVAYKNNIKPEYVPVLLERNLASSKKFPGKYYFTRDIRVKVGTMFNWPHDQILKDVQNLTLPIFVCESKNNPYRTCSRRKYFHEVLEELRKTSKDLDYHMLDGSHHLHLNEPEHVGSYIKLFIDRHCKVEDSNLQKSDCIFSEPRSICIPEALTNSK